MKPVAILALTMIASALPSSADWQPLWPGEAPGGVKPVALKESTNASGHLTDIEVPQYETYLPDPAKRSGAAVVQRLDWVARRRIRRR